MGDDEAMVEKLGHRPELDGLRGIAALLVVLDHALVPGFDGGGLGVDLFFALSGFLITGVLVTEWELRGSVDLRRFWWRRALRLLPAVWMLVAVCWLLGPLLSSTTRGAAIPTLLYFTNWQRAFGSDAGAFGHTWSLSIEEQFYIVWPLALVAMLTLWGRRRAMWTALGAAVAISLIREVVAGRLSLDRIYNGTDLRLDGLLYGCALALWGRRVASKAIPLAGVAVMVILFVSRMFWVAPWLERTGIAAGTCALIAGVHLLPRIRSGLSCAPLTWVGRRSYGVYLWHYPLCAVLVAEGDALSAATAVGASLVVAAASYCWIETPFLRLKDASLRVNHHEDVTAAERHIVGCSDVVYHRPHLNAAGHRPRGTTGD